MDDRALELLELPAILERLAAATESEPGGRWAAELAPATAVDDVVARQELTSEAIALIEESLEPDLGIAEVRPLVALAARGSLLDPAGLRTIGTAAARGLLAREALTRTAVAPRLTELALGIDPELSALAERIGSAVEEDGSQLRDDASPTLRRLRRELRSGRARLAERLRKLARDTSVQEHLQDAFVTERAGRPVLAVRTSSRSAVPGIVHDSSGSGQTLFVEPFAVVDDSNRLREAESAERDEVERILRELSREVGARAEALEALEDAVGALDVALASARLSRGWRGVPVAVSEEIVLRAARHPLLDQASAVPIDLELGGLRAVVVSGPNTGGKTVALKTLGLAALLHQCGLRPPAEHVELPVFDAVLVDIGDEQSIEMSLSTFSGHVRNLVAILEQATERSLVLLDEVAAGTDPVEGAALAQALVGRLARQARLTVVTSHYAELKEWASASDEVTNAATGFDPATGAPLYRVTLGRPGTSHALRIAEQLGLPGELVAEARSHVVPERLRVGELLAEAEAAEERAASERETATVERAEAERSNREASARVVELEEEIERVRASAHEERERAAARAEHELTEARSELDALRDEIRAARALEHKRARETARGASTSERERDRRLGAASERVARAGRALGRLDEPLPLTRPLEPGDPVIAPAIGVRGTLVEVERDDGVVIGRGGLRVRVPLERLRPDRDAAAEPAEPASITVRTPTPTDAPSELDLRGRTGHDAREAVRAFVDTAALAGRDEVRVIHGRGTGAIRRAVRDELGRHPLVTSHESDSADGATIVRFG